MEDEIDALHGAAHSGAVGDSALDEGVVEAVEVAAVAGAEVVENDDVGSALEVFDEMAADEAGAASDEDAHEKLKKSLKVGRARPAVGRRFDAIGVGRNLNRQGAGATVSRMLNVEC